ncbi:MAG TPA: rhomboid family intramembrane serine protease [Anaerolineaceae bacterium]|nr:rhomboid family intramembrane serine protease [Anaerolineaceae bacterium]
MNFENEPTTPEGEPTGTPDLAETSPSAGPSSASKTQKYVKPPVAWVTYTLMVFCILIYLVQLYSQSQLNLDLPFIYGGKINQAILLGQFWRFITPAFLHGSIYHLMFNMYALYILGNRLENIYGHGRFTALYFVSAFGGNVLSFVLSKSNSLGSSTAIFGLLAANLVLLLINKEFFGENFRPIIMNLVFLLFINLSIGLMPGSSIDNFGHLGGLIAGGFCAVLAGPKWKVLDQNFVLVLKDSRSKKEIWFGTLIVLVAFIVMASIPFLKR